MTPIVPITEILQYTRFSDHEFELTVAPRTKVMIYLNNKPWYNRVPSTVEGIAYDHTPDL